MLQGNSLKLAAVQGVRRTNIVLQAIVVDSEANSGWILVNIAMVGHRNDDGFQIPSRGGDCAVQIGGKGCDPASAGKRVSDERNPVQSGHVRASCVFGRVCSDAVCTAGARDLAVLAPVALVSLSPPRFTFGPE